MPNLAAALPPTADRASALAQVLRRAPRGVVRLARRSASCARRRSCRSSLKGVMRGDDAARAVEQGCAAVIVSNHGGRQLDGVPATIDALPEVVDAVAGRAEVLVDGGVRWGTDVLKALALGARAVLLGRPILWGLAVDGEAGVRACSSSCAPSCRARWRWRAVEALREIDREPRASPRDDATIAALGRLALHALPHHRRRRELVGRCAAPRAAVRSSPALRRRRSGTTTIRPIAAPSTTSSSSRASDAKVARQRR